MQKEPFIRVPVANIPFRVGKAPFDLCEPAQTWQDAVRIQKAAQAEAELFARAYARRNDSSFNPKSVPVIKIFQNAADVWECLPASEVC